MRPNFYTHLHPPTIPATQSRWRYTLGAGGTALFMLSVAMLTGALEVFYYIPTTEKAAYSVQQLTYLVPFGWLIRNLHYWSAQLTLVFSIVHLLRVVFTGAYASHRAFNYLLGLTLFLVTIFWDFSGYVLRWDTGIQWALIVGVNLLKSIPLIGETLYFAFVGGVQIGETTLLRFYAWHIFGLTFLAGIFLVWHIFRIRRDGGIALPPRNLRAVTERISRTELVRRESLAMFIGGISLLLIAVFFPAPIAVPFHEVFTVSSEARAPWFFLWIQEMLTWGDPFLWGVLLPTLIFAVLALIPYLFPQPDPKELGRWFPRSNRLAQAATALLVILIAVLSALK